MNGRRKLATGVFAVLATGMGVTGIAWACTPQPLLTLQGPATGPATSSVSVKGQLVPAGPAEVRWNSATGPVVGSAVAENSVFATNVTIPKSAPGVYYLVLVSGSEAIARAAFEVTTAGPTASTSNPWEPTSAEQPASSTSNTTPLTAGMVLLSVGLVGLAGGTAVAVTTRKRVRASR